MLDTVDAVDVLLERPRAVFAVLNVADPSLVFDTLDVGLGGRKVGDNTSAPAPALRAVDASDRTDFAEDLGLIPAPGETVLEATLRLSEGEMRDTSVLGRGADGVVCFSASTSSDSTMDKGVEAAEINGVVAGVSLESGRGPGGSVSVFLR